MVSLEQADTQTPPMRAYLGAGLVVAGLGGLAIGSHSVLVSVFGGSLLRATAAVGVGLAGLLVVAAVLAGPQAVAWAHLGAGGGLVAGGIGAFVVAVPVGWDGGLGLWAAPAVGAYGVGLVVLLTAFFSAALTRAGTADSAVSVTVDESPQPHSPPAVSDGGDDDDELEFLLDEDDDDG